MIDIDFTVLGWAFPLVWGIASSFTHCVGMCGPIQMSLQRLPNSGRASLFYHSGRIFGYTSLGLLFGVLGSGLHFLQHKDYQQIILLVMAALYFFFALQFLFSPQSLERIFGIFFPQNFFYSLLQKPHPLTPLGAGTLASLLPCPSTIGALAWTLTLSSPWLGGLSMLAFGVATLPIFIVLTRKSISNRFQVGGLAPRLLGLYFMYLAISRVYSLTTAVEPACH